MRPIAAGAVLALSGTIAGAQPAARDSTAAPSEGAAPGYLVFVAAESADRVSLVRFGPGGGRVEREFPVGVMISEPDGPHGVAVSPDARWVYVTTGHGTPYGHLWKYDASTGEPAGKAMLGNFPASLQVSPDGQLAYVANFNLHGDMVPSSVSVVATGEMIEVARIETCTMPHGSRLTADGSRHYSACMMDDMLVEIDTRTLAVSRHFMLAAGREHGMSGRPGSHGARGAHGASSPAGDHATSGHRMSVAATAPRCSPTWAVPSPDGGRVYVACNASDEIVEVDARSWTVLRRIPAGPGVYNLAVTSDGRLIVGTNKRGQSVSVFDAATGKEIARIPTKRPVVHGVVISPDDLYAFVSVEGKGSEPGTVEVLDLTALASVAAVDVGQQAGGIDVWRTVSTEP